MPLTKAEKAACQAANIDPVKLLLFRREASRLHRRLPTLPLTDVASIAAFRLGYNLADDKWKDAVFHDNAYSACATYPQERNNLRDKIAADDCVQQQNEYARRCDCCGAQPIAVLPLFNRFKHTARLCEVCLQQALDAIHVLRDSYLADGP